MSDRDSKYSPRFGAGGPNGAEPPGSTTERLKAERVQLELESIPGWELSGDGGAISRSFGLPGSLAAVLLVGLIAVLASEAGQHPEMTVVHSTVVCSLTTPEVGGVTEKDLDLARRINRMGTESRAGSGLS